jgi:hypothetical protein
VVDDTDPEVESDLRRRAAWLLVMLAIAAILLIIVISALVSTDKGGPSNAGGPAPLDPAATSSGQSSASAHPTHHRRHHQPPARHTRAASSTSSTPPAGQTSCPSTAPCILEGDIGSGIPAINAWRTQHGLPAVPGSVSAQAQTCAVHNGNNCSGGWAETELADPNGQQAVQKILPFAHLDDPQMKSIEVGWAYDPGAKLYYFAIVRID